MVRIPWKNNKFTKPAFNVGAESTRQLNATMAFRWRADGG